jgi:hypothetical protein
MSYGKLVRFADSTALSTPSLILPDRRRALTTDGLMTFDASSKLTVDSTGAFLIGELERLDQTLHDPLVQITWPRDIMLREDVTIADEWSSFTNSSFAAPGGINPTGKNWTSKDANAIAGIAVDIGKTAHPLYEWGMEVKWTLRELASAAKMGRPIDDQKYSGMKLKHQMDIDEMVYIGDSFYGQYGLTNLNLASPSLVTPTNAVAGVSGSTLWTQKTPDEILNDINTLLTNTWLSSFYAVVPRKILLPPSNFSYIVANKVSGAGNVSILEYVKANSLTNGTYGIPLDIQPLKWLTGRGVGGTNRMVAYTNDRDRVRFPMVPMQRTPVEYRSLYQITTYYCLLGCLEAPYSSTIGYVDGI